MGQSIDAIRAVSRSFEKSAERTTEMTEAIRENTKEVKKINAQIEKVVEEEKKDWRKFPEITTNDRYPLVQDSPPAVNVKVDHTEIVRQTQVNITVKADPTLILKKLNVI